MILKKYNSELSIYQAKDNIYIPISWSEGIDIDHKKSQRRRKVEKWMSRSMFALATAEALFVGSQFYQNGINIYDIADVADITALALDFIEFGAIPLLIKFGYDLNKKDNFLQQYLYLDKETVKIKLSIFKKYQFKISTISNFEFRINKYNQNYLVFLLKDGTETVIKWFQGALTKEQKQVSDAFLEELQKRIYNEN